MEGASCSLLGRVRGSIGEEWEPSHTGVAPCCERESISLQRICTLLPPDNSSNAGVKFLEYHSFQRLEGFN